MRISFRQGVVRHQTDANRNPIFLSVSGGAVSLVVSPDPTIVTFAHGDKNYIFTEKQSVTNAWPGPYGATVWLYWDIDVVSGVRTFGATNFAPTHGATAPAAPAVDQHWFDTANTKMKVWNGSRWIEKIRVFAARLLNSNILASMGADSPQFTGTQVGLNTSNNAGAIAYDKSGKPIKTGDGGFFTTEDPFTTGVSSGSMIKIGATIVEGHAVEDIPAGTAVMIKQHGEAHLADPYTYQDYICGVAETQAMNDEVVRISVEGVVSCIYWNWFSYPTNTPLYIGTNGQILPGPTLPDQLPFAVVVDPSTIMLKSAKMTVDLNSSNVPNASDTVAGIVRLATDSVPVVVATDDPRLTNARTPTAHTHPTTEITGLTTSLDGKANEVHTHVVADVTDFAHVHAIADVTNLDTALTGKADATHNHDLAYSAIGHNHDGAYALLSHSHPENAAASHLHDIGDVNNLTLTLDGKAPVSHTHNASEIPDLSTGVLALVGTTAGTIAAGDHSHGAAYAAVSHAHAITDVTGLDTALTGKADATHNHDGMYAVVSHDHTGVYALDGHNHDLAYSAIGHDHAGVYSVTGHSHVVADITDFTHSHTTSQITDFTTDVAAIADTRIASAGISDLSDVDTQSSPPANGNALIWNTLSSNWKPADPRLVSYAYVNQASFPSAATYDGILAHDANEIKMFYSHAGSWTQLANNNDVITRAIKPTVGLFTSGNIAVFDVNGDLADGGDPPSAFALVGHNHDGVYAKLVAAPTASIDPGNAGDYAVDTTYTYFYTGTVWVRIVNDTTPW